MAFDDTSFKIVFKLGSFTSRVESRCSFPVIFIINGIFFRRSKRKNVDVVFTELNTSQARVSSVLQRFGIDHLAFG